MTDAFEEASRIVAQKDATDGYEAVAHQIALYINALVAEGLSRDEAMLLAAEFQRLMWLSSRGS